MTSYIFSPRPTNQTLSSHTLITTTLYILHPIFVPCPRTPSSHPLLTIPPLSPPFSPHPSHTPSPFFVQIELFVSGCPALKLNSLIQERMAFTHIRQELRTIISSGTLYRCIAPAPIYSPPPTLQNALTHNSVVPFCTHIPPPSSLLVFHRMYYWCTHPRKAFPKFMARTRKKSQARPSFGSTYSLVVLRRYHGCLWGVEHYRKQCRRECGRVGG